LVEEDVLEEEVNSTSMIFDKLDIMDDYTKQMEHRNQAYSQSRGNSMYGKHEDLDSRERSSTLFSKSLLDNVTFEDF
jgi:hypothetical protein